jgi:hypothetical protein
MVLVVEGTSWMVRVLPVTESRDDKRQCEVFAALTKVVLCKSRARHSLTEARYAQPYSILQKGYWRLGWPGRLHGQVTGMGGRDDVPV